MDKLAHHVVLMEQVLARASEFDIIHWHIDYLHFSLSRRLTKPHVSTLHGRLDLPDLQPIFEEFSDIPLVSISDAQRIPVPRARWVGTVMHGLPPELYEVGRGDGGYFAFIGRISREKRVDRAIAIAKAVGVPLKIAAKIDSDDTDYFKREIEPMLHDPLVEFMGEIGEREKRGFLGNARAMLFPIDWPEPFGLVMIEAMACGTPVLAYRCGSVPEVMRDGVTGYIVDSDEQALAAAARIHELDRRLIRREFEQRFTARTMARGYLDVYRRLTGERSRSLREAAA
jgi:glycosyltransferase involved in cell wall biosynthesis